MQYYLIYLAAMSLLALVLYKADKEKAKRKKWRISEKTLLLTGFLGGAVGALVAMQLYRHKTKHWYFWAVNILGLIFQMGIAAYIFWVCAGGMSRGH